MRPGVRIRASRWCRARRRCTATWRRCWRGQGTCCRWSRPPGRPTATPATAWPATSPSGEWEIAAVLFVPTPLHLPPHGAHSPSNCRPYCNSPMSSSRPQFLRHFILRGLSARTRDCCVLKLAHLTSHMSIFCINFAAAAGHSRGAGTTAACAAASSAVPAAARACCCRPSSGRRSQPAPAPPAPRCWSRCSPSSQVCSY